MRKFLIAFALLGLPALASAQTPPATTTPVSTLASTSISTYTEVTGLQVSDLLAWTTNNITLFIGSAIVAIVGLQYWIAAIIIILLILALVLRTAQFFRH